MKNFGVTVEYDADRADDLRRAFNAYCHSVPTIYPDAMEYVVNMPSRRFWVSEERAAIVIGKLQRGESISHMLPTKQEMFREIYSRYLLLRKQFPTAPINHLARRIVCQPAPKFYMLPSYARAIMRKHDSRWREETLKKLQHLL